MHGLCFVVGLERPRPCTSFAAGERAQTVHQFCSSREFSKVLESPRESSRGPDRAPVLQFARVLESPRESSRGPDRASVLQFARVLESPREAQTVHQFCNSKVLESPSESLRGPASFAVRESSRAKATPP